MGTDRAGLWGIAGAGGLLAGLLLAGPEAAAAMQRQEAAAPAARPGEALGAAATTQQDPLPLPDEGSLANPYLADLDGRVAPPERRRYGRITLGVGSYHGTGRGLGGAAAGMAELGAGIGPLRLRLQIGTRIERGAWGAAALPDEPLADRPMGFAGFQADLALGSKAAAVLSLQQGISEPGGERRHRRSGAVGLVAREVAARGDRLGLTWSQPLAPDAPSRRPSAGAEPVRNVELYYRVPLGGRSHLSGGAVRELEGCGGTALTLRFGTRF